MRELARLIGWVGLVPAWICEFVSGIVMIEVEISFPFIVVGTVLAKLGLDANITDLIELDNGTPVEGFDLVEIWIGSLLIFQLLQLGVLAGTTWYQLWGGEQDRLHAVWIWQPLIEGGHHGHRAHSYEIGVGSAHDGPYVAELHDSYHLARSRLHALVRAVTMLPAYLLVYLYEFLVTLCRPIAWAVLLLTGRFPSFLYAAMASGVRLDARFNAYYFMLTDRYPPFSFSHRPDYPCRVEIAGPQSSYDRRLVALRWIIGARSYILYRLTASWLELMAVPVWFVVVVTGRHPQWLFDEQLRLERFVTRANAYFSLMSDRPPPLEHTVSEAVAA